jgi:effector-binding domain-containing protein
MPRVTDIALFEHKEMDTLVVRTTARVQDLPMLIGRTYGNLAAYLAELNELIADMPFVAYHNMDMQALDVELGFPVARKLPGKGEIQAGIIPGGPMVSCLFQGPYRELQTVYTEMAKWIQEKGHIPTGVAYECYCNGPEYPENQLLTKIMMPVQKK